MTIRQFLEANLWAILSAAIMALLAYVIGTTNTAATLRELGQRVTALEDRSKASEAFHNCATRHFDRIESGASGVPPCDLGR